MLLFLTSVLVLSSFGMIALLYAKHWELSTGRVLFAGARPHVASYARAIIAAVEYHLPNVIKRSSRALWNSLRAWASDAVARSVLALEHGLERTLQILRHGMSPARHAGGQASAFLREVAEHKRKLTHVGRAETERDAPHP